jgi:hypothetical protein
MRTGDVPAVTEWLRAKAAEFRNLLADLIIAQTEDERGAQAPN